MSRARHTTRTLALFAALVCAVCHTPRTTRAGAPPGCTTSRTQRVLASDLIVVARATGKTMRTGRGDALRTPFVVIESLHGALPRGARLDVRDCHHWKCDAWYAQRGQRALLYLNIPYGARTHAPGSRARRRLNLIKMSCRHGHISSVIPIATNARPLAATRATVHALRVRRHARVLARQLGVTHRTIRPHKTPKTKKNTTGVTR